MVNFKKYNKISNLFIVPYLRQYQLIVIFEIFAIWLVWWTLHNPLPDGYQNEYLHVGNAYDLFEALIQFDFWHLRWYAYTSYWPWGFYAVPWVLLLPFGKSISILICSNLLFLGLLVWSMGHLSKMYKAPFAPLTLLLCPAVFGSLTRYEPNFANIAIMSVGLLCILRSESFTIRKWSIAWGSALGLGLMLDRLTMLFFLFPAILPIFHPKNVNRTSLRNIGWGLLTALLWTIAYYREFFIRHLSEITSQAPVGEIDATGSLVTVENPVSFLYYVISLGEHQMGWGIACLTLMGLIFAIRKPHRDDLTLWASFVPALFFFTVLAKKQVYYTMPILVPLTLLMGRSKWAALGVFFGGVLWLQQGWGVLPNTPSLLPPNWDEPSFVVARPPSFQGFEMDPLLSKISETDANPAETMVFSSSQQWYEGFVVVQLRQEIDGHVRGVTTDPQGLWEFMDEATYFVWVHDAQSMGSWPSVGSIEAELLSDHYELDSLPALAAKIAVDRDNWESLGQWDTKEEVRIELFYRKNVHVEEKP